MKTHEAILVRFLFRYILIIARNVEKATFCCLWQSVITYFLFQGHQLPPDSATLGDPRSLTPYCISRSGCSGQIPDHFCYRAFVLSESTLDNFKSTTDSSFLLCWISPEAQFTTYTGLFISTDHFRESVQKRPQKVHDGALKHSRLCVNIS